MTGLSVERVEHVPVLKDEVLSALNIQEDSLVVDATYGRGGHSKAIVSRLGNGGRLLVIDRDPAAINQAREEWSEDERVEVVHAPFSQLSKILSQRHVNGRVTGLLFDLGVSSPQLDNPERGFSFSHDGPLDMRMDPSQGITAAEWLARVEEAELAAILRGFGEERFAKKIARKIKQAGEISTTGELAEIIAKAAPSKEKGKHPATRSFQAIRIALNSELDQLESVLPQTPRALAVGGRLVIISFHSLEDRLVKRFFREQSKGDPYPPDLPITHDMLKPTLRLIGKAIKAGDEEIKRNRRARSAVLRVAEKVA